jgi:hypothetical protein
MSTRDEIEAAKNAEFIVSEFENALQRAWTSVRVNHELQLAIRREVKEKRDALLALIYPPAPGEVTIVMSRLAASAVADTIDDYLQTQKDFYPETYAEADFAEEIEALNKVRAALAAAAGQEAGNG